MNDKIQEILIAEMAAGARAGAALTSLADRNLTQALGVIMNTLVQQHGGVADDAAVMAALRTTIHIPQKATA